MTSSDKQRITNTEIFLTWLPLTATWCMMAIEQPFVNAIAARLPDPEINLAALGVVTAASFMLESPILLILSAANVLVDGKEAYLKLRNFTVSLSLMLSLAMALLFSPLLFPWFSLRMLCLPQGIAALAQPCGLIFSIVPFSVAYRRFYQGILIRNRLSRLVAAGTAVRFMSMGVCAIVLFRIGFSGGALAGAIALSAGMAAEAVAARLMCHEVVLRFFSAHKSSDAEPVDYYDIMKFYLPLAAVGVIVMASNPIITFFLSRSADPVKSLAVVPVVNGIVFLLTAVVLALQEVVIGRLGKQRENWAPLKNFAIGLAAVVGAVAAVLFFTPLVRPILAGFLNHSQELVDFAVSPVRISALTPLIAVWGVWQRSVLMHSRRSTAVTFSGLVELLVLLAALFELRADFTMPGADAACLALLISRVAGCIYLRLPYNKVAATK